MIKVRLTYVNSEKGNKELNGLMESIDQTHKIVYKSEPYLMRGSNDYRRMYIEIESREQE